MMRRFSLLSIAALLLVPTAWWTAPSPALAADVPALAARSLTPPRSVTIAAADGIALSANVIQPTGQGKHPAIVFIASWALNDAEYLAQAHQLAAAGYVVLSYTPRGFWNSGGEIDVAGPLDLADVSTVLDWLIANTTADPAQIGVGGVSYGAGIGLVAAAHDPRIRAVAAMSTWTDLTASLYGDQTRRGQAVALLKYSAELTGRPSPKLRYVLDSFFANRDAAAVRAWADARSAASYLPALNRNAPAVLIANAFGDSLFPPNQLVEFHRRFTGPKRLELAPGDHAVVEASGLFGLPNHVWTSARRWFDTHLAGRSTGIEDEHSVVLRVRGSQAVETAVDFERASGKAVRYGLGVPGLGGTGVLGGGGSWRRSIWSGGDTVAYGGIALLSNGWDALTGLPPTAWLPAVDRMRAMVWISAPLGRAGQVRGMARLRTTVTGAAPEQLLVAYLYDVDPLGNGKLITHVPRSGPGPVIDVTFPATAYDVPAGHRLGLVIDTEDALYLDTNSLRTVAFSATAAQPGWLDVPLR